MLVSVCLKTGVAVFIFLQISFYGVKEQPCMERWAQNSWAASGFIDMTWGLPVSSADSDLLEINILGFFAQKSSSMHGMIDDVQMDFECFYKKSIDTQNGLG